MQVEYMELLDDWIYDVVADHKQTGILLANLNGHSSHMPCRKECQHKISQANTPKISLKKEKKHPK